MYLHHFGFTERPFSIAPDPRYLYMSAHHREALAHLLYGVEHDGGFVVLTGEVGTGKTTICRAVLDKISHNKNRVAFILNPKLTVLELLETICDELHIERPESAAIKAASIKGYVDRLNSFLLTAHSEGRNTILIIDEAQNLSAEVLEQLRLLTNLETSERKLLQIILIGQPELREMLARADLRQLAQRVTARFHLTPLAKKEVNAYLRYRLSVAGVERQIFPASLVRRIFSLTGGIPRLVNVLCDRALLGAYAQGKQQISRATLDKAALEVFGERARASRFNWRMPLAFVAISLLLIGGAAFWNHNRPHQPLAGVASPPISEQLAWRRLLEAWNIPSQAVSERDACTQALANGLNCLSGRGAWEFVSKINRPVVLTLRDEEARPFPAALIGVRDDKALVYAGNDLLEIELTKLKPAWNGNYVLLWMPPPQFSGELKLGDSGPAVQWLATRLNRVTSGGWSGETFDENLRQQLMRFQQSQGLNPDGVAGPQTLIQLATATGSNEPRLFR